MDAQRASQILDFHTSPKELHPLSSVTASKPGPWKIVIDTECLLSPTVSLAQYRRKRCLELHMLAFGDGERWKYTSPTGPIDALFGQFFKQFVGDTDEIMRFREKSVDEVLWAVGSMVKKLEGAERHEMIEARRNIAYFGGLLCEIAIHVAGCACHSSVLGQFRKAYKESVEAEKEHSRQAARDADKKHAQRYQGRGRHARNTASR